MWGGHSCPPLLTLVFQYTQNQLQKRRARAPAPHFVFPENELNACDRGYCFGLLGCGGSRCRLGL